MSYNSTFILHKVPIVDYKDDTPLFNLCTMYNNVIKNNMFTEFVCLTMCIFGGSYLFRAFSLVSPSLKYLEHVPAYNDEHLEQFSITPWYK